MLINEGFGANSAGPLASLGRFGHVRATRFALRAPYPAFIAALSTGTPVWGNFLINLSSCVRTVAALSAVAVIVAGCAAANNATSAQASAEGEQPYKTMYGLTSEGTTTDLYTELFGPRQPPPGPSVAAAQPVQPVAPAPQMAARTGPGASGPGQVMASYRAQQPAAMQPAPVQPAQVAQQPAPPAPPPEPDVPAAYGITSNGPTTDLYTMIFGSKRDSQ